MPHDIIDNPESYLADAVRPLLSQSVRAHFAAGYFFFNGFKAIASEPGELEKVFADWLDSLKESGDRDQLKDIARDVAVALKSLPEDETE